MTALSPRTTALLLTLAGGIILTLGDIAMKTWVTNSRSVFYAIGLAFYFVASNFVAVSFKYENIAVASALLIIFNVVTLILVTQFLFHEPTPPVRIAGIALALAAVVVLELG